MTAGDPAVLLFGSVIIGTVMMCVVTAVFTLIHARLARLNLDLPSTGATVP